MAIPCETCGAENPETNRFCGQCGRSLQASPASDTPEEFWRDPAAQDAKPLEAAADLPREVIDFDNQVPLLAGEGTDRRMRLPPGMASEVHDHLEREAEIHDQLHHASEAHYQVIARGDASRSLLDVASEKPTGTGVSGPSFLGLSEDGPANYVLEDDEEPRSHMRRNVALAVLAVAVVLVAGQWRSMRDYGLAYMQNGSMQVRPRSKDDPRNPPAVAADNTGRDLGLPPASAKPGAPKALESSPNADHTPLNAQRAPQTDATSQAKAEPPISSSPQAKMQPPAMSAPPPDLPRDNSAPANTRRILVKPTPSSRNAASAPAAPGADEMNRALRASDAEARAAWLWRAVGKGNPQAPMELARMYERGNGVVQSCAQAQVLLRSAAAKGNEQAKLSLQQMRIRGGCSVR